MSPGETSRLPSSPFSTSGATELRWLLHKDLRILRRSPLLAALLVIYPIAIAVLIGFALSGGPDKPRVAFLNQVPTSDALNIGGEDFDIAGARNEFCERLECVEVADQAEAEKLVTDGEVLGAVILPEDLVTRLQSLAGLNPEQPTVIVIVNEEDPVKGRLVDDRISSLLAEANLRVSSQVSEIGITYLDLLLEGGSLEIFGQSLDILGLQETGKRLQSIRSELNGEDRRSVDRILRFATLAEENLAVAAPLLEAVSQPIQVDKQIVSAGTPSLDTFAIAVAATITLMFVTVLLVAGSLALEREENTFVRLTRGLAGPTTLLAGKIVLGLLVGVAVTLVMMAGLELFLALQWERIGLWILAFAAGAAAFAAFGAAIGAAAGEVRASSLLAFMVSLPIAFLSLIPSGTVGPGLFDVIEIVAGLFPFDPALSAISSALEPSGPSLGAAIGHLAGLTLAYGALARAAMGRLS